jgi:hypothetical protein
MDDDTSAGGGEGGFDDPTAPAWSSPDPAPPTQPVPTEPPVAPPSPYVAPQPAPDLWRPAPQDQNPYGQPPYPLPPYDPAAAGQEYSQSPYAPSPYGSPFGAQTAYGSTAYGQPPYSMPPTPYGAPPARNTSAIVLTVISAVTLVACCNVLAIPSLILGILGLTKAGADPQGAARMAKAGWITFGITMALAVIGWLIFFVLVANGSLDGSTSYDYEAT